MKTLIRRTLGQTKRAAKKFIRPVYYTIFRPSAGEFAELRRQINHLTFQVERLSLVMRDNDAMILALMKSQSEVEKAR